MTAGLIASFLTREFTLHALTCHLAEGVTLAIIIRMYLTGAQEVGALTLTSTTATSADATLDTTEHGQIASTSTSAPECLWTIAMQTRHAVTPMDRLHARATLDGLEPEYCVSPSTSVHWGYTTVTPMRRVQIWKDRLHAPVMLATLATALLEEADAQTWTSACPILVLSAIRHLLNATT